MVTGIWILMSLQEYSPLGDEMGDKVFINYV